MYSVVFVPKDYIRNSSSGLLTKFLLVHNFELSVKLNIARCFYKYSLYAATLVMVNTT